MVLLSIGKIEQAKSMLDTAFHSAAAQAGQLKTTTKAMPRKPLDRARALELKRCFVVQQFLTRELTRIVKGFPSFDELAPFYVALCKATLDLADVKQSLGAVQWAREQIASRWRNTRFQINSGMDTGALRKTRTAFYGRVSSVMKQINKNLKLLDQARQTIRQFPSLKTGIPTIAIAGYPNVGKSTLLKALTGSAPAIASYPFTTQRLMLGYIKNKDKTQAQIQLIDTPGLLDRPLAKRNTIEVQAILALEHLTKAVLFVIDPSPSAGYSLEKQHNLLDDLRKRFHQEFIMVINKADLVPGSVLEEEQRVLKQLAPESQQFLVSAEKSEETDTLKEFLLKVR